MISRNSNKVFRFKKKKKTLKDEMISRNSEENVLKAKR